VRRTWSRGCSTFSAHANFLSLARHSHRVLLGATPIALAAESHLIATKVGAPMALVVSLGIGCVSVSRIGGDGYEWPLKHD